MPIVCESVSHVLWDCPVYNTLRNDFMSKFWVSCGRMTLALCLILSRIIYIVDIWELRKARLYHENLSVPQSQCQNSSGELGGVGDGGRLKCLHGKVDTTISCMCTCSVGSAQCSGCVVYGPGAMAAI